MIVHLKDRAKAQEKLREVLIGRRAEQFSSQEVLLQDDYRAYTLSFEVTAPYHFWVELKDGATPDSLREIQNVYVSKDTFNPELAHITFETASAWFNYITISSYITINS